MTIEQILSSKTYPKKVILEKLVCHTLGLSKEALFITADQEISQEDVDQIHTWYEQYTIDKKPLEYILGYVTFTGIHFEVTPDTLIPRPETEYMIEAVNEHIQGGTQSESLPACPVTGCGVKGGAEGGGFATDKRNILDIGTGCGVLGLAVLYHNNKHITKILLSELGPETLAVAQRNSEKLFGEDPETVSKISLVQSDLLDHPDIENMLLSGESTILVANLPYIPEELFENNTDLGIKKREPKMAFVAGEDGLDLYRNMFDQLLEIGGIMGTKNGIPTACPVTGCGVKGVTSGKADVGGLKNLTMFLEMMTWQCDILRKEYTMFEFEEVKTFHFNIRILKVCIR